MRGLTGLASLKGEMLPDPAVSRMRGVLHLKPMFAPAGAIAMIEALRDNAFKTHVALDLEQSVADVALLKLGDEDSVDRVIEQLGQRDLAHRERQRAESSPSHASASKA
jgi:hypothetical protein